MCLPQLLHTPPTTYPVIPISGNQMMAEIPIPNIVLHSGVTLFYTYRDSDSGEEARVSVMTLQMPAGIDSILFDSIRGNSVTDGK